MRQSVGQAVWAGVEYLAYPVLMFLSTPFLIRHLGVEAFGLWMLVAAIAASWGLANLGVAPMITRYVAMHRDEAGLNTAVQVVRFGLGRSLIGGAGVGALLLLGAPWLAAGWLHAMGEPSQVIAALQVSALMIVLAQIEFAFKSALKGFELFGVAARLELVFKTALVAASVMLVWRGMGIEAVLLAMPVFALLNCVVYGLVIARIMGGKVCLPRLRKPVGDAHVFAGWNWLQIISGVMFHQVDRLLIGSLLGAAPLGVYAVCMQVAQQIHALPAALFSFLLPRMSRAAAHTANDTSRERLMLLAGAFVALALGGGVILLAPWILDLWMGEEFSRQYGGLLAVLAGGYLLLSINVVPHFLTLAAGSARYISILNLVGGILAMILCVALIYDFELLGVAVSKYAYGLVLLLGYWKYKRDK